MKRQRTSAGFTLLELTLVLAVLVLLASLAQPSWRRGLTKRRLIRGAEQVRTAWAQGRLKAIEDDRTYAFRFVLNGEKFSVEPWIEGAANPASSTNQVISQEQTQLPDECHFHSGKRSSGARELLLQANNDFNSLASEEWSEPLFFYSDGTSSTGEVVIKNDDAESIRLHLRGVTGAGTMSDVMALEDVKP